MEFENDLLSLHKRREEIVHHNDHPLTLELLDDLLHKYSLRDIHFNLKISQKQVIPIEP